MTEDSRNLIKNFLLDKYFSQRPGLNTDWDVITTENQMPQGFVLNAFYRSSDLDLKVVQQFLSLDFLSTSHLHSSLLVAESNAAIKEIAREAQKEEVTSHERQ